MLESMQTNLALLELIYKSSPSVSRIIISNANIDFFNAMHLKKALKSTPVFFIDACHL